VNQGMLQGYRDNFLMLVKLELLVQLVVAVALKSTVCQSVLHQSFKKKKKQ